MTDQLVSPAQMHARGQHGFATGRSRDDHGMNQGSPDIQEWQEGWDGAHVDQVLDTDISVEDKPCA